MNAGQLFAASASVTGVILLLGWLLPMAGNPRTSTVLLKSVLLFVLPTAVVVALPEELFQFPLSLWVVALIEECLKATAAASERRRVDRFFLVALFGIWELIWVKPLWGLNHSAFLADWSNLQLVGLTAGAIVTVLMHTVTAEIYAFRFQGRLWLAMFMSWLLHVAFNESVDVLGVSLLASLLQFAALLILFAALWPKDVRVVLVDQR